MKSLHSVVTVLGAFVGLVLAADPDAGWELLATSMGPEVPRTCYPADRLPEWLRGGFFISGPAKFEMGNISFKSLFDGYGRVNRFEMHNGKVCYTSVWLNTDYYKAAKELGEVGPGVLFEGTIPPRPSCPVLKPWCDLTAPLDNNWVNMLQTTTGQGLLLTDAPNMLRFDLETLTVHGVNNWTDVGLDWKYHRSTTGSAHPVMRPGSENIFLEITSMIPIVPFADNYVAVYSINASEAKTRTLVASVPTKDMQYFHSFGVTENYVVLPMNMKMGISAPDLKHRLYMVDNFKEAWDGIHVVDLNGKVQRFDTDKFFHVHISNTFENSTGIVMDIGVFDHIPFHDGPQMTITKFFNKTLRDAQTGLSEFRRYHLHTAGELKGSVTKEVLSAPGRQTDFYKINPAFSGKPYCYAYMSEWFHDDKSYASMAILKHDFCKGTKLHWYRENTYPGEPTFIANSGKEQLDEDDGVVVFVALDGEKRHAIFVVLDAKTFEELAIIDLPTHIPFTAHGQFVPLAGSAVGAAVASATLSRTSPAAAVSQALKQSFVV